MLVGVDVGGTFTDFVGIRGGELLSWKVPSMPRDPGAPLRDGLGRLDATEMAHGTTVATNAVVERQGVRTAFVTTAGFEDLLEIGRQDRPSLYDFHVTRTPPVVPRTMALGVRERVGPGGRVLKPLSKSEVTRVVRRLRRLKADSVAVCLLFSFANSRHERELAAALRGEFDVSVSSRVLPEFREYERGSTTALDAYVKPTIRRHLTALEGTLGSRFLVMKSSGGTADSREVLRRPIDLALSGPAGGVSAALTISRAMRIPNLVTFDMGGTSADFSVVVRGAPTYTNETLLAGLPLALPVVDIVSIGAGGGSIAWVDSGGALRVGPQSAGAEPGPMCYGLGGMEPTVTDADLLGGLLPAALLGGRMPLRRDLSEKGIADLAGRLRMSVADSILGVRQVVEANMVRGIKSVLAKRGLDPEELPLLAFGGAGPVHAAFLAREIGIRHVLVPFLPGSFSAYGILTSDVRLDLSHGIVGPLRASRSRILRIIRSLRSGAEAAIRRHGFSTLEARYDVTADLRYAGQSYEINVPWSAAVEAVFRREHRRRYGYASPTEPIEVVAVRIAAIVSRPRPLPKGRPRMGRPVHTSRRGLFEDGSHDVSVWTRSALPVGFEAEGPAVIEEDEATTVVPPGARLVVQRHGVLEIRVR